MKGRLTNIVDTLFLNVQFNEFYDMLVVNRNPYDELGITAYVSRRAFPFTKKREVVDNDIGFTLLDICHHAGLDPKVDDYVPRFENCDVTPLLQADNWVVYKPTITGGEDNSLAKSEIVPGQINYLEGNKKFRVILFDNQHIMRNMHPDFLRFHNRESYLKFFFTFYVNLVDKPSLNKPQNNSDEISLIKRVDMYNKVKRLEQDSLISYNTGIDPQDILENPSKIEIVKELLTTYQVCNNRFHDMLGNFKDWDREL